MKPLGTARCKVVPVLS